MRRHRDSVDRFRSELRACWLLLLTIGLFLAGCQQRPGVVSPQRPLVFTEVLCGTPSASAGLGSAATPPPQPAVAARPHEENKTMTIKNLFRFARLAPARIRRPARPAAPLSLEGLEERRLLAADMPMPTDGGQPLATDSHAGHAMDLSQAPVTIMPLGASRVAGGRPAFESYRYELWNDLTARGWAVDFIGTQSDDAAYPELASRSFDTDHEGRSGWTSGDILADLGGWLAETGSPDIVLVSSPGGNDLLEGLDYGQTLANINGIIDLLQQDNPGVTVIIEQPAPGRSDFMTAELTAAFAQLRDDVAGIAATVPRPARSWRHAACR
jgi:hypothetical protein